MKMEEMNRRGRGDKMKMEEVNRRGRGDKMKMEEVNRRGRGDKMRMRRSVQVDRQAVLGDHLQVLVFRRPAEVNVGGRVASSRRCSPTVRTWKHNTVRQSIISAAVKRTILTLNAEHQLLPAADLNLVVEMEHWLWIILAALFFVNGYPKYMLKRSQTGVNAVEFRKTDLMLHQRDISSSADLLCCSNRLCCVLLCSEPTVTGNTTLCTKTFGAKTTQYCTTSTRGSLSLNYNMFLECKGEDTVKQTAGDVRATEGDTVTLGCTFQISVVLSAYLFWYKQEANDLPLYILRRDTYGTEDNAAEFKKDRFDATLNNKSVPLQISSAAVTDSAVYYCALQPTVTGNTNTLYKNLWSKDNTILISIHQREPLSNAEPKETTCCNLKQKRLLLKERQVILLLLPHTRVILLSSPTRGSYCSSPPHEGHTAPPPPHECHTAPPPHEGHTAPPTRGSYCSSSPTRGSYCSSPHTRVILLLPTRGSYCSSSPHEGHTAPPPPHECHTAPPPPHEGHTAPPPTRGSYCSSSPTRVSYCSSSPTRGSYCSPPTRGSYCSSSPTRVSYCSSPTRGSYCSSSPTRGIKPERSEEHVAEGRNISLTCKYEGTIYNIQWYRQYQRSRPEFLLYITEAGVIHPTESDFSAHIDKTEKRVDLEIISAAVTDSAVYYCALRPTCKGEDTVKQTAGDVRATEGNTVTLGCTFQISVGLNAYLFWYKQEANDLPLYILRRDTYGTEDNAAEFKKDRFDATLNETSVPLQISSAAVTDSAVYYCALSPQRRTSSALCSTIQSIISAAVKRTILTLNAEHQLLPAADLNLVVEMEHWLWIILAALFFECKGEDTVKQTAGDVRATEGDTVTLGCTFQTSYTANMFWYKQEVNGYPKYMLRRYSGGGDNAAEFQKDRFDATSTINHDRLCCVLLCSEAHKEESKPSYYKLEDKFKEEVCLATGFSSIRAADEEKKDIFNNRTGAVRIDGDTLYNQVAYLSTEQERKQCEADTISSVLKQNGSFVCNSMQPDPQVNLVSLTVLGLRLLFMKTVVFNVLLTLRLWITSFIVWRCVFLLSDWLLLFPQDAVACCTEARQEVCVDYSTSMQVIAIKQVIAH
ncbi:hypothetical protein F7725_010813 [Dissostichus mawsoni]|uniref:Ig-like domain-containing protein n=1 Tax=Dissostichus mawsoni TaxID=36200 RepID=A0A7J5Z726_DISMA|nr:hypothetical protein F7725_010813 [Dissostichus mawsoni]